MMHCESPQDSRVDGDGSCLRLVTGRFRGKDVELVITSVTLPPPEEDRSFIDEGADNAANLHRRRVKLRCEAGQAESVWEIQLDNGQDFVRTHGSEQYADVGI